MALEADARAQPQQAEQALQRALQAAPNAVRPMLMAGQRLAPEPPTKGGPGLDVVDTVERLVRVP